MATKREIDEATQTETTGHEWDGIKELDTPMPRWWLWTFYATIVWGVIYTILFPAWPLVTGATPGPPRLLEPRRGRRARSPRSQRRQRAARGAADAGGPRQRRERPRTAALRHRRRRRGLPQQLRALPRRRRRRAWSATTRTCSTTTGSGAARVEDIRQTVTHGIRYEADPDTRYSQMPAFGDILQPEEIDGARRSTCCRCPGRPEDPALAAEGRAALPRQLRHLPRRGRHRRPRVRRARTWPTASGSTAATRRRSTPSIANARFGVMPAFGGRLRPEDIAKVAVYVHTLGGGE